MRRSPLAFAIVGAAALAALAVPVLGSAYAVSFTIQLLVFLVLAYSWNLIGGYAGYTHFGQVSFFGVGAYVGTLLMFHWGVQWYLAAVVAGLSGIVLAIPLGGAMLRLKGPYFAIGMFGLARVLEAFALGFDSITQGGTGIYLKPMNDLRPLYVVMLGGLCMIVAAICVQFVHDADVPAVVEQSSTSRSSARAVAAASGH